MFSILKRLGFRAYYGGHAFSVSFGWHRSARVPIVSVSAFYAGIHWCPTGDPNEWPREIGFRIAPDHDSGIKNGLVGQLWGWHDALASVSVWSDGMEWRADQLKRWPWKGEGWSFTFRPFRWIFGDHNMIKKDERSVSFMVELPEGDYQGTARLYKAAWTRPRWPVSPEWFHAGSVTLPGGIPEPYKGDDDAMHGCGLPLRAVRWYGSPPPHVVASDVASRVMEKRIKEGGARWVPRNGWPAHCIRPKQ